MYKRFLPIKKPTDADLIVLRRKIMISLKKRLTHQQVGFIFNISKQKTQEIINDKIIYGGREFTRDKIRQRDNYTCQICGKVWQKGQRRFDVHHIDCIKEKTRQCDNYELEKDNMITLCHKCHFNLPEHRNVMTKKYSNNKFYDQRTSTTI
jgi:hypothetical protein